MIILLAAVFAFVLTLTLRIRSIADLREEKVPKFVCSHFLGGAGNTREANYKSARAFLKPLWKPPSFVV